MDRLVSDSELQNAAKADRSSWIPVPATIDDLTTRFFGPDDLDPGYQINGRSGYACGRCRSKACTSASAVRWATRNSPVTSDAGTMSSALRIWGRTGRWTQITVGSP